MTTIHTLATPGLGDRSYVAALDGWAIAVDVQRDLDRVERLLDQHQLRLGAVVETHLHNDYLTGGLVLSRRHGAEYVVPAGPPLGYSARRGTDGGIVRVGPMELSIVDTPGHTDAHAAYALHGEDGEVAAFTGGSLLLGATGRSDLLGIDRFDRLARQQYWSVRRLARLLGPDARLFPTHGFGSFCSPGAVPSDSDTIAAQHEVNPAFLLNEDDFVADMAARLGDYPAYYQFMAARNAGGVDSAQLPEPVWTGINELTGVVIDVRPRQQWAAGHLRGSLAIDCAGSVATWLGWLEPIDTPVSLVVDDVTQLEPVVRQLHRVGFDEVRQAAVWDAGRVPSRRLSTMRADFGDLDRKLSEDPELMVIDVREDSEWRHGHLRGALHVPVHRLDETFAGALPLTAPWLHCAAGFRAAIGASVLERLGCSAVVVDDDLSLAEGAGLPWCDAVGCGEAFCTAELRPALSAPAP